MNPIIRNSILAGMMLAASAAYAAEVVVDDFTGTEPGQNMLPGGGSWLADADTWPAIGGSSKVRDPIDGTSDLVKGDAFAGDNIVKAYTEDGAITSKIYVTADVSPAKKWAYAGWIVDFIQPKPKAEDTAGGKHIYDLQSWQKGNEVNVGACDQMDLTIQFDTDRLLWIDLFSPQIERMDALAPQHGWRYTGTGALETKTFKLHGVTGPAQKWKDDAHKVFLDQSTVSRIRFLYEGMLKGVATASYDTVPHVLKTKKVAFSGANCKITENRYSSLPIVLNGKSVRPAMFSAINGNLQFGNLASELNVTVRNIAGNVVAEGSVNGSHNSLNVSALKNGVYMVQAAGANFATTGSFTVLK